MATESSGRRTTEEVAGKAHETVDRVAEGAGRAEEAARERLSGAGDEVREKVQYGKERADDLLGSVSGYIRDYPLTAIGLAFVAGTLYASLKRRR
ncbi:hypothetical protein [Aquisalimonas sp.]|uniref:hypothetical protein n=1 Tax=Aquisalimonas sp. TaxID=1872621 RepID=UPI0025B99721|nr:hypothetical protein [Aquisalimonas sp.]